MARSSYDVLITNPRSNPCGCSDATYRDAIQDSYIVVPVKMGYELHYKGDKIGNGKSLAAIEEIIIEDDDRARGVLIQNPEGGYKMYARKNPRKKKSSSKKSPSKRRAPKRKVAKKAAKRRVKRNPAKRKVAKKAAKRKVAKRKPVRRRKAAKRAPAKRKSPARRGPVRRKKVSKRRSSSRPRETEAQRNARVNAYINSLVKKAGS